MLIRHFKRKQRYLDSSAKWQGINVKKVIENGEKSVKLYFILRYTNRKIKHIIAYFLMILLFWSIITAETASNTKRKPGKPSYGVQCGGSIASMLFTDMYSNILLLSMKQLQ